MVIDYTPGDYKNLHIENVESWHGEANGLTIYKESYINLQNLIINNIRAGTKFDEQSVTKLTLLNLVPKACAVDIHEDTLIHYINGDDTDNIISNNIIGFETCDQSGNDMNKENEILNNIHRNSKHIMSIIWGIIIIIIAGLLLYFIYRLIEYITFSKSCNKNTTDLIGHSQIHNNHNRKFVIIHEKTPLLDTI